MTDWPAVTVAVLSWQGAHLLPDCLHALARLDYQGDVRVWVVDNGSTDGTDTLVHRDFPDVDLVSTGANLGFAGGYNVAFARVSTPYVALLNNDARPEPDWLTRLVQTMRRPDAARTAAVTSKLLLPDGRVNNAGGLVYTDGYGADRGINDADDGRYDTPVEVFAFCGAAALLRTDVVHTLGGFDRDLFLYYEDTELSWRMRRHGWSVRYEPAVVYHLHSATTGGGSPVFRFHNERNRLVVLTVHAAWWRAIAQVLRYSAGAVRQLAVGRRSEAAFRVRVLGGFGRMFPRSLRKRRALDRVAVTPRNDAERWLVPVRDRRPDGGLAEQAVSRGVGVRALP